MSKNASVWERTPVDNLLRNRKSGRYYGRWKIAGKQIWRRLDTDVFTVAKLRVKDEASKVERLRGSRLSVTSGAGSMGDLMRIYEERTNHNGELRQSSIKARLVALLKLKKTWPGIENLKPRQITAGAVLDWATRFKVEGTKYTPPGAKTVIRGNSATSVNRAIDTLRRLMDMALERGAIHTNPVNVKQSEGRLKKKISNKKLILPSVADAQRIFVAMENNGARGGWGKEAADFCRALSFSGCRIAEAGALTWECVDWDRKLMQIKGQKTETSNRTVPLFAELEVLLKGIVERRKAAAIYAEGEKRQFAPTDQIFRLSECQKTLDRACAATGVARITHHDFRHLFATRCIESGVDIPTVSRWLGHADGGALAMRTYGHLRQEHSQAQARKVVFANPLG